MKKPTRIELELQNEPVVIEPMRTFGDCWLSIGNFHIGLDPDEVDRLVKALTEGVEITRLAIAEHQAKKQRSDS